MGPPVPPLGKPCPSRLRPLHQGLVPHKNSQKTTGKQELIVLKQYAILKNPLINQPPRENPEHCQSIF